MSFQSIQINNPPPGTLPFDFNCDGVETAETPVLNCPGLLLCDGSKIGFKSSVNCGDVAALGHCANMGLGCAWTPENPAQSKPQKCK